MSEGTLNALSFLATTHDSNGKDVEIQCKKPETLDEKDR